MGLADLFQRPARHPRAVDPTKTDEATLVDRACRDADLDVRRRAVDALRATPALRRVAVEGRHLDARLRAIDRIADERVLAGIMRERKNPAVMLACLGRIRDPEVLGEIARDPAFNPAARRLAVRMFSEPALHGDVLNGLASTGHDLAGPGPDSAASTGPDMAAIEARVDRLMAAYPPEMLVEALAAFRDAPGSIRAMGVLLARGGAAAPRAAEVLTRLLKHARARTRALAADALAPAAADFRAELTAVAENDPDPRVRDAAARVLDAAAREEEHP